MKTAVMYGAGRIGRGLVGALLAESGYEVVFVDILPELVARLNETHRYANDYRKRAMKKRSYAATLTAIPGVGEKTSAALLAHFKTVAAVKAASISDLEEVKGISHAKAEMLYNALRNGV